jgi:UPF0755 protein
VINNESAFVFLAKVNGTKDLQIGTYELALPANINDIQKQLDEQTDQKILETEDVRETVKVTIKEGDNMDQIIEKLVEKKVIKQPEMIAHLQDSAQFKRDVFTFLPTPLTCAYGNLSNCAKYYPEGYFYPDTYEFFIDSKPKEVSDKFLNNFNKKVWSEIKKDVTGPFQKVVTLASVVQLETGRTKTGVTEANKAEITVERQGVAQVFLNRNNINDKWRSDITAEYGHGKRICQQTFTIQGCIGLDSPQAQTLYNTYLVQSPIAPVSNPDVLSIKAALKPSGIDSLFFVSDISGKTYFAKTAAEHEANIVKVQGINASLSN